MSNNPAVVLETGSIFPRSAAEAVKGTRMEDSDPGVLVARVFMTAIIAGAKL